MAGWNYLKERRPSRPSRMRKLRAYRRRSLRAAGFGRRMYEREATLTAAGFGEAVWYHWLQQVLVFLKEFFIGRSTARG